MKAIFMTYDQAYGNELVEMLEKHGQRGFTQWQDIGGRGSKDGIPHLGNHAWPAMNNAILVIVEDALVPQILSDVKAMDEASKDLGLRAFTWNIEEVR